MVIIGEPIEFIWNRGNKNKNWIRHKVANQEVEEVFSDRDKRIFKDQLHSEKEKRFILLGKTKKARLLYTVFTIRRKKIRIISSRDINKKEVRLYEKTAQAAEIQKRG